MIIRCPYTGFQYKFSPESIDNTTVVSAPHPYFSLSSFALCSLLESEKYISTNLASDTAFVAACMKATELVEFSSYFTLTQDEVDISLNRILYGLVPYIRYPGSISRYPKFRVTADTANAQSVLGWIADLNAASSAEIARAKEITAEFQKFAALVSRRESEITGFQWTKGQLNFFFQKIIGAEYSLKPQEIAKYSHILIDGNMEMLSNAAFHEYDCVDIIDILHITQGILIQHPVRDKALASMKQCIIAWERAGYPACPDKGQSLSALLGPLAFRELSQVLEERAILQNTPLMPPPIESTYSSKLEFIKAKAAYIKHRSEIAKARKAGQGVINV